MTFGQTFLIVFGIFMAFVMYEGVKSSRGAAGEEGFLVADRRMGAWVGGGSIAATQMSAGTFVGTLGIHYTTGSSFLAPTLGIWAAFLIVGFVIAPRLRRYIDRRGALTFPDYIADRFGNRAPRLIVTVLILISYTVFISAQYQAGGVVFETIFGIPFVWGSLILMAFIVAYTIIGGMTAVMRTDLLQQCVMAGGVIVGVPFAIEAAGGLGGLGDSLSAAAPEFTGWHYDWVDLLGFSMGFGFAALSAPVLLMRYYAMRDEKTGRRASVIAVGFTMVTFGCVAIIGMCMRLLYPELDSADAASSIFAINVLPDVFGALLLTAVIAAVVSTVDSVLLVVGPAVSHDLYATYVRPDSSERTRMRINRIATLVLGVLPLGLTVLQLDAVQFIVLAYAALIGSTIFAPLVFGIFWRRANRPGAVVSMISGFSICALWYAIGQPVVDPVIPGIAVSVIAMVTVSLLTPRPNAALLEPFFGSRPSQQPS